MDPVVVLVLPRTRATVPETRALLERVLADHGGRHHEVEDLVLAVTEACANAVRHASGADDYRVEVCLDDESCTVEIRDTGRGFERHAVAMPSPDAERGRGLAMMDALVDRAEVRSAPGRGTLVRLTKRFRSADSELSYR